MDKDDFYKTALLLKDATTAVFLTGAGMSADSGIPTYRDDDGFWKSFAPYLKLNIKPIELATPHAFEATPELAWGLFEWKRRKCEENVPHSGYKIINSWIAKLSNSFIHTTNIDGYHERSGCSSIYEVHGSIWRLQCCNRKCKKVTTNTSHLLPKLDLTTMKVSPPFPICNDCESLVRPNMLMFGDWEYIPYQHQVNSWLSFLKKNLKPDLVFMIGCNKAIPVNEMIACALQKNGSTIVVINPDAKSFRQVKADVYIPFKAKDALQKIDTLLA